MTGTSEEIRRLLARYRAGELGEDELLASIDRAAVDDAVTPPSNLAEVLDRYRAAEASGAETLEAWAAATSDQELVGGLRAIAARESAHARLLERRVVDLGRAPSAKIPDWLERYNAALTARSASDLDRLTIVVEQFPDPEVALAPLQKTIDSLDDDVLTRELLRVIADDELATLRWVHSAFVARKP